MTTIHRPETFQHALKVCQLHKNDPRTCMVRDVWAFLWGYIPPGRRREGRKGRVFRQKSVFPLDFYFAQIAQFLSSFPGPYCLTVCVVLPYCCVWRHVRSQFHVERSRFCQLEGHIFRKEDRKNNSLRKDQMGVIRLGGVEGGVPPYCMYVLKKNLCTSGVIL